MRKIGYEELLGKLKSLIKPILKICIRNSLKLQDLIEVAKIAYVEVVAEELEKQGTDISISKISVISGVHRKDVSRILSNKESINPKPNAISRIMVQWQYDPRFTLKSGKPKRLNFEGRNSEFNELVESVNGGNLNAYAVLFEMRRMGILEEKGKKIKLLWRDFAPDIDLSQGLDLLATDIADLTLAVEQNIFEKDPVKHLHLKTEFDKVSKKSIPEIKQWLLKEGSLFHKKVREYLADKDADLNPNINSQDATCRVAFGSFGVTLDSVC